MTSMRLAVCIFILSIAAGGAMAADAEFSSGPERTVMIELYTSEGCSSCPPAERYLNGYADHPALWTRYIPLAFHVDYWDYLGWKDRFSQSHYSQRQRQYAGLGHVRGVYTPALIANGRAWRPGLLKKDPVPGTEPGGTLRVAVAGQQVSASFEPAVSATGPVKLNLALLGMGLSTEIKAGERAGRLAPHEFVVLGHKQASGSGPAWQTTLPTIAETGARRLALAAWVSRPDDPTPLQATGGYLR